MILRPWRARDVSPPVIVASPGDLRPPLANLCHTLLVVSNKRRCLLEGEIRWMPLDAAEQTMPSAPAGMPCGGRCASRDTWAAHFRNASANCWAAEPLGIIRTIAAIWATRYPAASVQASQSARRGERA